MADNPSHSSSIIINDISSMPVNRLSCTIGSLDIDKDQKSVADRPSSPSGSIQDPMFRSETQRKLHDLLTAECLLSILPCSGCGCEVAQLHEHPLFADIGTCVRCLEYLDPDGTLSRKAMAEGDRHKKKKLIDTGWERDDDEKEIYCRLCGEGGEILQCDLCVKAICRLCLSRWLGEDHWRRLTESDDSWYCPDCQEESSGADSGFREAPLLKLIRKKQWEPLFAYLTRKASAVKAAIQEADVTANEAHPAMPPRQHPEWPVWLRNGRSVEVYAGRQWREATVIEIFPETCYCRYRKAHGLWNEEIPADRMRRLGAAASIKEEGDVLRDGRPISVCLPERPVKQLTKLTIKDDISKGRERIAIPLVVDQIYLDETKEEALSRVVMPKFIYIHSIVAGRTLMGSVIPIRSVGACVGCQGDRCHREPSARERELRDSEWSKRSQVSLGDADCGKTSLCSWGAYNKKGYLKATMDCVVECNFLCACDYKTCPLRVVQKGITKRLEVFWTGPDRGWGLRCLEPIEAGAFICEYAGELLSEAVTEVRGQKYSDGYFFDLSRYGAGQTWNVGAGGAKLSRTEAGASTDGLQCQQPIEGESAISVPPAEPIGGNDRNSEFTLDAHFMGNVGRFINHSCSPNLARQLVLVDTHDYRLPRIAFFAEKDIEAGVELVYDYGYRVGLVAGKTMKCECGSDNCKKILY